MKLTDISELDHDGQPLDAWVLNTLPRAFRYAQSLLTGQTDVEDLVHDCYCRLLEKAHVYDFQRDGTRLLYRSITNACIDRARKHDRTVSIYREEEETELSQMLVDHKTAGPSAIVEERELADAVGRALQELPLTQRAALELKSMGHSLAEIAAAVQVTEANAGVLVHRARRAVAAYLTKTYGEESA